MNSGVPGSPMSGGPPRQILPPEGLQDYAISSDGRLAGWTIPDSLPNARWKIFDLASRGPVSEIPLDTSDIGSGNGSSVRFSPDNRAAVYSVLRNAGRALWYQPLDGSASHSLFDPMPELIPDFGWSRETTTGRPSTNSPVFRGTPRWAASSPRSACPQVAPQLPPVHAARILRAGQARHVRARAGFEAARVRLARCSAT